MYSFLWSPWSWCLTLANKLRMPHTFLSCTVASALRLKDMCWHYQVEDCSASFQELVFGKCLALKLWKWYFGVQSKDVCNGHLNVGLESSWQEGLLVLTWQPPPTSCYACPGRGCCRLIHPSSSSAKPSLAGAIITDWFTDEGIAAWRNEIVCPSSQLKNNRAWPLSS